MPMPDTSGIEKSSPRPWRCFRGFGQAYFYFIVFSTSVEVFPQFDVHSGCHAGLLHVRGGVSRTFPSVRRGIASSPRPWRCFQRRAAESKSRVVFSTSVEVFPDARGGGMFRSGLLHVRGGV